MSFRARAPRTLLSSVGDVTVARRYYACRGCGAKAVPFDQWAGVAGGHRLTAHARRVVTLAGSTWSFDQAAAKLLELCHLAVSNDVVRAVCDEEGEAARRWLQTSDRPAAAMTGADGAAEFYTDGVKVNTTGGWREMRLSVFAKRPAAAAGRARAVEGPGAARDDRPGGVRGDRPQPRRRLVLVVGSSWRRMLGRLGLAGCPRLSVLADGARWIWDEAAKRFGLVTAVDWCVDAFHVSEHLHGCAARMFGPQTPGARLWAATRMEQLIDMQGPRFVEKLREEQAADSGDEQRRQALGDLIGYLSDNRDSLWYRTRLADGRAIGTGLIEGACKNTIGARLKINNPRWRVRRAERMAALRCLQYSDLWDPYWAPRTG